MIWVILLFIVPPGLVLGSQGSSVSIVSGYGLDDWAKRIFPLASMSRLARAHPAFCPMGTRGPFPGGKARPGHDTDHLPASSAKVVNEELYILSPPAPP
jgi:hypothetical protein